LLGQRLQGFAIAFLLLGAPLLAGAVPEPKLRAPEAGIYGVKEGDWLYTRSLDQAVPVASLTKLALALTFVRMTRDMDQVITITGEDWLHAGRTRLRVGDRLPARTLLRLALVASDNCAARALTHPSGLSWESYAFLMEQTARSVGCRHASFSDPTGLDPRDVASARDVVLLFNAALLHPLLRDCLGTSEFILETSRGPRNIVHSARLLRYRCDVTAAKTGYIDEAGYCLVQYVTDPQGDFVTVLLGAPTEAARVRESMRLIEHARALRKRAPGT
jgi:D-alanyl-D-alanine endopeptidase (penicillin-binding protein 7)